MRPAAVLRGRLLAAFATMVTATACADKSAGPVEPKPATATPPASAASAAPPSVGPDGTAALKTAPAPASAATVGGTPPRSTAEATLPACLGCTPLCYDHPAGEACLPANAGDPLDRKFPCFSRVKGDPQDDGKRCCYAQPCKGRPLQADGTARIAPLARSRGDWASPRRETFTWRA